MGQGPPAVVLRVRGGRSCEMSIEAEVEAQRLNNAGRVEVVGQRRAARAATALAILTRAELVSHSVWRSRWIEVLKLQVERPGAALTELAGAMDPPVTKNTFSGILNRACKYAEELSRGERVQTSSTDSAARQVVREVQS